MSGIVERGLRARRRRGESPALPASVQNLGAIRALQHVGRASEKGGVVFTRASLCLLEKGSLFSHQLVQAPSSSSLMLRRPRQLLIDRFHNAPP